jgi:hypothetical protein
VQLLQAVDERRADEARRAAQLRRELGEAVGRDGIAVDRDERAARADPPGEQPRVAARAERAVHDGLTGLRVEQLDRLAGEHRHVREGHLKQCGQGMW